MAATDKRRQAGHKHPKHAGMDQKTMKAAKEEADSASEAPSHLFNDRRKANGSGKRVV
jgi:hypothetical protein